MSLVASKKKLSDVSNYPSYHEQLPALSAYLTAQCSQTPPQREKTVFDGADVANISVQDYLVRLVKYGYASSKALVCMAIYINRLCKKGNLQVESINVHRLVIGSFLAAVKLTDDKYYSNKFYSTVGGLSMRELNRIERAFLEITEWDLFVSAEEYERWNADILHGFQNSDAEHASPQVSASPISDTSSSSNLSNVLTAGSVAWCRRTSMFERSVTTMTRQLSTASSGSSAFSRRTSTSSSEDQDFDTPSATKLNLTPVPPSSNSSFGFNGRRRIGSTRRPSLGHECEA
eukprot:Sspe_Gene.63727::Locus_36838_Transcript_1_1_Confidence_1.000_Length_969::g.63727::m.63727